jgi:hypothetical protein
LSADVLAGLFHREFSTRAGSSACADAGVARELKGEHDVAERARRLSNSGRGRRAKILALGSRYRMVHKPRNIGI